MTLHYCTMGVVVVPISPRDPGLQQVTQVYFWPYKGWVYENIMVCKSNGQGRALNIRFFFLVYSFYIFYTLFKKLEDI